MSGLGYRIASQDDALALADLRVAAMRDSLIAAGRFDAVRARARLLDSFDPALTTCVLYDGQLIGFYVLRTTETGHHLSHLYLDPRYSGQGLGARVMARIIAYASGEITLGALKHSAANRFYRQHGFERTHEDAHDIYYRRP